MAPDESKTKDQLIAELRETLGKLAEIPTTSGSEDEPPLSLTSRQLLDLTFEAVFLSVNGICVDANSAAIQMFGFSREECLGRHGSDFISPEERERVKEKMSLDAAGPYPTRGLRKDGRKFDIEIRSRNIYSQGRLIRVTAIRDLTDRKQVEQELRNREEYLRILFDRAADAIYVSNADGHLIQVNERSCLTTGYTREELLQRSVVDVDINLSQNHLAALHASLTPGSSMTVESRHGCKDGTSFPVEVTITCIDTPEGLRFIGFARDISERHRVNQALRENEKRFRQVYEHMAIGLARVTLDSHIQGANDAYCHMLGYREKDLIGKHLKDISHPETLPENLKKQRELAQGKIEHYRMEKSFIHKSGHTVHGILDANLIRDTSGNPSYFLGSVLDITDRKRTEDALARSERKWREILVNTPQMGVSIDPNGRITFANAHFLQSTGWRAGEILGKDWFEQFIPEDIRNEDRAKFMSGVNKSNLFNHFTHENDILTKYGERLTIAWSNVLTLDSLGDELELTCLGVDLTERMRTQRDLLSAKEQAETANRAKSEFLANMSHEIRTPLNGMVGMLQLLKQSDLGAAQREYTEIALESSNRLGKLLSDILDLSRIEARKMDVIEQDFVFLDTMDSVSTLFTPAAFQKGLALSLSNDPAIPGQLTGDSTRLLQILGNLVGNAIKFTKSGNITLEASLLPNALPGQCRILFMVSDTGIGMHESDLERLFEPFTQAESDFRRRFQGAGLGLSIVRHLVALLKGNMSIISEPGQGTIACISLPFKLAHAEMPRAPVLHLAPMEGLSILVAEDDPVSQYSLKVQLEDQGHVVHLAENGLQAMDILKEHPMDVILMDVQMPVMDGVAATRAIRKGEVGQVNKDTPIIAVTAYAMISDKEIFLEAGMNDYLPKPLDFAILINMLNEVSGGKKRS